MTFFRHMLLAVAMLAFFACSSGQENTNQRSGTESPETVVAKATSGGKPMVDDGYDGDMDVTDDNMEEPAHDPDKGGKGDDAEEPADDPDKGGKGDDQDVVIDNDDDDDQVGGKDSPNQNPWQMPDEPVEDDEGDEVVVDLPEEACVYNDPENPDFVIPANQFGPATPPMEVPSAKIDGEIQADGETFIGSFTIFQKHANSPEWMLDWDGRAGRIPHHYTLVVTQSTGSSCTAYLRHIARDPRTLNGCFDQNTKIRMADGTDRVIALVAVGDKVWNPSLGQAMSVAKVVRGPETSNHMYDVGFGERIVRMTQKHPVPTKAGLKMAKDITTNDQIQDAKGQWHQVNVAKKLPLNDKQIVINLTLATDRTDAAAHMVLSEGIVTGDLFLQEQLENIPAMDHRIAAAKKLAQ